MVDSSAVHRLFDESYASAAPAAVRAVSGALSAALTPNLDKRAATLTPPVEAERSAASEVVGRWRLKHSISQILRDVPEGEKTPGVCKCGTSGYERETVDLIRRISSGKPGVKGVVFCDSPWLCPSCAPKRAGERVDRVREVFDATGAKRGIVVFVTLTVQHDRGQSLADLKRIVTEASKDARRGAPWARAVKRFGIAGVIVSPEVTYGDRSGWHFHLHLGLVLLPIDGDDQPRHAERMALRGLEAGEWLIDRYRSYVHAAGARTSRKGQDVQIVTSSGELAKYVAKGSAEWEVASAGATKLGKAGNSPWDLAARASRGDAVAAELFKEYAAVMPGTRSCVITASLARKLDIKAADDADAPGVDDQADEDVQVVMALATSRWNRVLRNGCAADVLAAVAADQEAEAIDDLVARLLGETDEDRLPYMRPYQKADRPVDVSPSALELARLATLVRDKRRSSTSSGAALQVAIQQFRDLAARRRVPLVLPHLPTAMSLIGDGLVRRM